MSEILDKNLSFIRTYNPGLCEKILSKTDIKKNIELNTNLAGEYNLLINGMAVHSIAGAQEEAQNVFNKLPHNSENSIHIIYGLGLGYLFDEFVQKAKGSIIVFEPDIELLRAVLEMVDFTESFEKCHSFFVSDIREYQEVFEECFRYKTSVSLSSLDYYIIHNSSDYSSFKKEAEKITRLTSHNFSFQVNEIYSFLQSTVRNMEMKVKLPILTDYKDMLKNKPAVIVSAGPSLAKNIDKLKKYKDNVYIFCVGTALRTLCSNGITPDFVHVIERVNTKLHYNVEEANEMMFVCEPYTQAAALDVGFKQIFLTASEETDASRWFMDIKGKELAEFETKGTVSYHALFCAKYLGCSPIILIGQDLAYSDGNCYARGSLFEDLQCVFDEKEQKYKIYPTDYDKYRDAYCAAINATTEYKNNLLNKHLEVFNSDIVTVDGQNGEKLPTSNVYALFIEYISDFGRRFGSELTLINSSLGGANIEGFKLMDLESAVSKFAQAPIDKSQFSLMNNPSSANSETVIENISKDLASLVPVTSLLKRGVTLMEELKKETALNKSLSRKAEAIIGKASRLYVDITNNYTNKTRFLRMLFLKHHCEINYLMKEYKGVLNKESFLLYYEALNSYFHDMTERTCTMAAALTKVAEELKKN